MWRSALVALLAMLAAPAALAARPKWVAGEVLVKLDDRVMESADGSLFQRYGVRDVRAVFRSMGEGPVAPELFNVYRLTLALDADVEAAVAALRQDPRVEFAEPNFLAYTQTLPNDAFADADGDGAWDEAGWGQPFADLWGLERTSWGEVWERQAELWPDASRIGGAGVTVAVIDTGVDYRHPDLAANVWRDSKGRPGRDFVDIHVPSYIRYGYELVPGEDYRTADSDPSDRHDPDRPRLGGRVGRVAGQYSFSSPALRDLDGDGRTEIAVGAGQADGSGFLSLFDAEGTMMPGWPVATGADVSASPALVDLDGDGRREVLVPDLSGQLHALRADGRPLPGWPRDLDGWVLSSPVAADLDGDGELEVVLGRAVLGLVRAPIAMTFAIEAGPAREDWPTFKGDPRRTGGPPEPPQP